MFRRTVILLVATGWLLSQLALAPHIHSDDKSHTSQPHFHIGRHSHGHHPHSNAHSRQASDDANTLIAAEPEHDADACFVAASDASPVNDSAAASIPPSEDGFLAVLASDDFSSSKVRFARHSPGQPLTGHPRFLILRTLRI